MRIVIFGINGQVGYELNRSLSCLGEVIGCERSQVDLEDENAISQFLKQIQPDLIVNAAAYTAVDKAEDEKALAYAINATAPKMMANVAKQLEIPLIHYSTDYVFDGSKTIPWTEDDTTHPLGVYGETKLAGEQLIQSSGCRHLIFRTSWVYGSRGHNFFLTMNKLSEKEELKVVDDQIGSPTWSRHIADMTAQIVAQSLTQKEFWDKHTGLYHLTASGQTSWHGFAQSIFDLLNQKTPSVPKVTPIPSSEYPTPARRPHFSCLDNTKLNEHFGLKLPDWKQTLKLVMQDFL